MSAWIATINFPLAITLAGMGCVIASKQITGRIQGVFALGGIIVTGMGLVMVAG